MMHSARNGQAAVFALAVTLIAQAPVPVNAQPAPASPALPDTPALPNVPAPSETRAEILTSGRSSTPRSVDVIPVGQSIPPTYSGDLLRNAPGFSWYVSRHYALQTDYDAARAEHLLVLLELAYPHYVELFGSELPGIESRRMAVIYASSIDSLRTVLLADGIEWNFGGGGITYERFNAAFNYPSGSLQYHQRYIMLHEAAHLYQICLKGTTMTTPWWYYEGVADTVAHHVWDEANRRLTMSVVDKPTVNNWYDQGLEQYRASPFTASDILAGRRGGRDLGFLLVTYLSADPDRLRRFRLWRDELFRLNLYGAHQAESDRLIDELFGRERLDADFKQWLDGRTSTFHYVDWGWEQDADTLISYGWPQTGEYSQTDIRTPPGEPANPGPLVMDYPRRPRSPLVEPSQRGADEPVIGCLVGFSRTPNAGVAGMGLGVRDRSFVKVLIHEQKKLIIDATALGGEKTELAFSDEFVLASAPRMEIGLTIRIAKDRLEVTARTGAAAAPSQVTASIPITTEMRDRLLREPVAVLSRDGRHAITPYVD